jgi:hypothetical protein
LTKWPKDNHLRISFVASQLNTTTFRCQAALKYCKTIFSIFWAKLSLTGKRPTQKRLCAGIITSRHQNHNASVCTLGIAPVASDDRKPVSRRRAAAIAYGPLQNKLANITMTGRGMIGRNVANIFMVRCWLTNIYVAATFVPCVAATS